MDTLFEINFDGQEINARKLLLEKGIKTEKELSVMSAKDVEKAVNAVFEAVETGDDWLLIPRDRIAEFNAIVSWIER